ncbi:hypothetical protein MIT9_P1069 [Methylomarinovum caldicuralii]|uniref:VTC domain-containing protein n=1 Tax=Methylomarinovum caldicuralii TaxID=438856 RepID=A0AAU9BSG8_9GAMM|nr:polyphosphate polymerase domain-containing protein [Methylomarinovum caldicuralii]BCX81491.1 hypothetical protein MIT9_P1069 [Methylomarinovum caldicuralii]
MTALGTAIAEKLMRMKGVALGKTPDGGFSLRRERKFLLRPEAIPSLLEIMASECQVIEIDRQRRQRYRTLYFDTGRFGAYRRHHCGGLPRYKFRVRCYVSSGALFLEEKYKRRPDITHKRRRPVSACPGHLEQGGQLWRPVLLNEYDRIALRYDSLRLTIDWNLKAWLRPDGTPIDFPPLAVLEIKAPLHAPATTGILLQQARQRLRLRPSSFSKYCLSLSLSPLPLPKANFRSVLRKAASL